MENELQIYIDFDPYSQGLLIALVYKAINEKTFIGYCILNNGEQHSLFELEINENLEPVRLLSTESANPWEGYSKNLLNIHPYIDNPVEIEDTLTEQFEQIVQFLLKEWIVENCDDIDVIITQYNILGYQTFPLNIRPFRFNEMNYNEENENIWFEYNSLSDPVVRNILEEYI